MVRPRTRTSEPRFPPTASRALPWPGSPLPPIDVDRAPVHLVDGWLRYTPPPERVQLDHELAIRGLLKLDIENPVDVVAFIAENGVLASTTEWLGWNFEDLPPPPSFATANFVHAKFHLLVARCLARHWLADRLGEDVVPAWHELALPGLTNDQAAWGNFTSYLSTGLEFFHPRIEFTYSYDSGGQTQIGRPRAGLYSALCHQLFNLFVEEASVLRCENETCGQAFVRQAGSAQHGQYRTTGVIYCSRSCARAQAERQRRRRIKGDSR